MKDALRFLWDANAYCDPKILRLRARHGIEGYGAFQILVCLMREAGSPYQLRLSDIELYSIQLALSADKLRAIVDTCLAVGLFEISSEDEDLFFARALVDRMSQWDEIKRRRSEAGKIARAAQLAALGKKPAANAGLTQPTPIQYNTIQDNTIQYNTIQPEAQKPPSRPPEPPKDLDPIEAAAESMLEEPVDQPWTRSNEYINAGWRPMRKFPGIMISMPDLAETLRQITAAKVPKNRAREIFAVVEAALKDPNAYGQKRLPRNPMVWLTGWALKQKLEQLKTELQIEHTEERHAERRIA